MLNLFKNLFKKSKFKNQNHGVIPDPRSYEERRLDWVGIGAEEEVLCPNGQWDNYLPGFEPQFLKWAETYACTNFSSANCLETLLKRKYGIEYNLSDRKSAITSGTRCNWGNYLQRVADDWRHTGFLYEFEFPNPTEIKRCEDYYIPIPQELLDRAKSRLNEWEINYCWINSNEQAIKEALKYAPLQVVINNGTHAVMCYGYEGNKAKIYDSYLYGGNPTYLCTYLYDIDKITAVMKYNITKKETPKIRVDEKYGDKTDDFDLMFKIIGWKDWLYIFNQIKRNPTKREFYGLTAGRWDFESVFKNKNGDIWLYYTKPEAKEKKLI